MTYQVYRKDESEESILIPFDSQNHQYFLDTGKNLAVC